MGSVRIDLTLFVSLTEVEARLLFDHADSNHLSITDAVQSLILESLTFPGSPVHVDENPAKFFPPTADFAFPAANPPDGGELSGIEPAP